MSAHGLRICQLNFADHAGGAERMASLLHDAFRERGCDATLHVGQRRGNAPGVEAIDHTPYRSRWCNHWWRRGEQLQARGRNRSAKAAKALARPAWALKRALGQDDHDQPGTAAFIAALHNRPPDIIHAHNLHGSYFDLRQLPDLARVAPLIITLHDEWLVSDGPAYRDMPGGARRSPATLRLKQSIYEQCRLRLVAPSQWMLDRVAPKMPAASLIEARRIPYGIDTRAFQPAADRAAARRTVGLDDDAFVVLFVGQTARQNPAKDFATVREAVRRAAEAAPQHNWMLVVLGDTGPDQSLGHARLRWLGSTAEPRTIAARYHAADVLAHAAHVENFPVVVLEAMACARPVVATDVGGIGEQVDDGRTGRLVPPADAQAMSAALVELANDPARRAAMGEAARAVAVKQYDINTMVDTYLDWFCAIAEAG